MSKSHDTVKTPAAGLGKADLLEVRGDLPRLAWAIGARLSACQFADGCLIVPRDPVLEAALEHLGASLRPLSTAFSPDEGTLGSDVGHRHARRHVQFHVARLHADDGAEDDDEAEAGPPAANA